MMEPITELLRKRWFQTLLTAILLALTVWFFGPLLGFGAFHPFDSQLARAVTIVVILLLWALLHWLERRRERRRDEALADAVTESPEVASAAEVAVLRDGLREALAKLRHARIGGRRGRQSLYQLPWYLFIGPPGAGKTTALVNSGLRFPLADAGGAEAIKGVGGTRNCDWWFTEEAVLIDTAGRYTTQDSEAAVDAAGWLGFLRLLKKHRSRQPLNGVLVAIGLPQLAALSDEQRTGHARAVRRRLRELHDELGVRVPAYVVFTKTDLVPGFVDMFDGLSREEREQVWGTTLALDDGRTEAGGVAAFGAEFDALLARLEEHIPERLQQETDLRRRRLIYGFPQQLAALRTVAAEFLDEAFRPNRLEPRGLLRGVYLTSGTQDGTPIDRLMGAMAGQFGLQRQAVAAFSGAGRSYFLGRMLRDVVFAEAGLVGLDPKVERRRRTLRIAEYGTAALVLVGLTAAWAIAWADNRATMRALDAAARHYEAAYTEAVAHDRQRTDLAAVVPVLDAARALPGGYDATGHGPTSLAGFGLSQAAKLHGATVEVYRRALDGLLLPRLLFRLEGQMQSNLERPAILYEALKVYLILGRQGPMDRALVEQWIGADLAASFPGDDGQPMRDALASHLAAMLETPLPAVSLNGPLVAEVRAILTREPLADYVYNRVMRSAAVRRLPEWAVADNSGPGGARVFVLRDGKPLDSGVPGIFTTAGYHDVFLHLLPAVTRQATEEAWVLGRGDEEQGRHKDPLHAAEERNRLHRDVLSLYLDDYARRWDAMLADVVLKPFTSLQEGQDELFLLSAPDSPLRDLLLAIDAETQLAHPSEGEAAGGHAAAKLEKSKGLGHFETQLVREGMSFEQNEAVDVIGEAFGNDEAGKRIDPAQRVEQHFAGLHTFVTATKDAPAALDTVIARIGQIYQRLNQAGNAANQGQALLSMASASGGGGEASAAQQIADAAKTAPKPVADMLQTVTASSSQVASSGAAAELAEAWKSKVLPLCQQAFDRFPFVAASTADVPADDFSRLLGPGGLIDAFFDQYLKPFVDTDQTPWRWQAGGSATLGLSDDTLVQFERASEIRDALFPDASHTPSARFDLKPTDLDAGLAEVSVEIAGSRLTYAHGPQEPMPMQWPGPGGTTGVRVILTPADGSAAKIIEENGPWALLRLIGAATVTPSGQPDKLAVSFASPAGKASFEVDANSVRNPFTLTALSSFRCPASL